MYNAQNDFSSYGQSLWQEASSKLQIKYGDITYKNWLSHLVFASLEDATLQLSVPSRFVQEWIVSNYLEDIQSIVQSVDQSITSVSLVVVAVSTQAIMIPSTPVKRIEDDKCDIFSYPLDSRLEFEDFAVGESNQVAYAACMSLAQNKKLISGSSVIYLHSAVGMGKTHLLQSIASYIRASKADPRAVLYLSAEKFMHLYLKYLRANDLIGFKEKLKSADVLLIDDLQFICGKAATSQEFSNILTALSDANKSVVISSDSSPFALNLDVRAKSRLIGGLVVEITQSHLDLRLSILKKKCKRHEHVVADDILHLIAERVVASNRELEGALSKLITYASLTEKEITIELVNQVLKENFAANDVALTPESILDVVSKHFKVEADVIKSKSRVANTVLPRQIAAYLLKTLTTKSLQEIGKVLGGRDHASVIYYVKQIEAKMQAKPEIGMIVEDIQAKLN